MDIAHQKIDNVNEIFGGRYPPYQVNQIYKKSGMHSPERLVNPQLSGLPAFLIKGDGPLYQS